MATELITTTTGIGALNALRANLQNVVAAIPQVNGKPILRMLNERDGWVFEQENVALPLGTQIVINTPSLKHGYVCWTNRVRDKNERLEERVFPLSTPLPSLHDLPVLKDPKTGQVCDWKLTLHAEVKVLTGRHKGTELIYKPSSLGGTQALGSVINALMDKFESYPVNHTGPFFVLPIVELQQLPPYSNRAGGKTYPPSLPVVGWMDLDGNVEGEVEDRAPLEGEPALTEEPLRRRRRV